MLKKNIQFNFSKNYSFKEIIHLFFKNYSFKENFIQKNWQLFIKKKFENYSFKKIIHFFEKIDYRPGLCCDATFILDDII